MSDRSEILSKYKRRDGSGGRFEFMAFRRYQNFSRNVILDDLLEPLPGYVLSAGVLDVGCGDGWFLRYVQDRWPSIHKLVGIDFLETRIESAKRLSNREISYSTSSIGEMDANTQFGLVTAFTVLSSISSLQEREALLKSMWNKVVPGGRLLVVDLRYNNPRNTDVSKVTAGFVANIVQSNACIVKTGTVPPFVFNLLGSYATRMAPLVELLMPPLRCHLYILLEKGK